MKWGFLRSEVTDELFIVSDNPLVLTDVGEGPAQPLGLLAAMFALWRCRKKSWGRACLFGFAYFIIALGPVLGVFNMGYFSISRVSDHLQYLAMPGIIALKMYPTLPHPDQAYLVLVKQLIPTGLKGLLLAGMAAALMGHVATVLNSASTIVEPASCQ